MVKRIPATRVAELSGTAAGYEPEFITPVIQPLFRELSCLLAAAGIATAGPPVAYYEDAGDDAGSIKVHAGCPVADRADGQHGFNVVELSEVGAAATLIHQGSMNNVLPSVQSLARWIDANGYQSLGYAREFTLKFSDIQDDWVTELAEPITPK
jgi:effector-binding domain-containing protein